MKTFRKHLENKLKNKKFEGEYLYQRELLSLSKIIAETRTRKGISQIQLAKAAGITQQQLSKIENGLNCNIITFLKASRALDLNIEIMEK
jgi:DNA-binding XRE family transcriptional regulator